MSAFSTITFVICMLFTINTISAAETTVVVASTTTEVITTTPAEAATTTTSTIQPTTTITTSKPVETAASTCVNLAACYNGSNTCDGRRCHNLGYINTCKCTGCIGHRRCESDKDCGGLHAACNLTKKRCDCTRAFLLNGFQSLSDVYRNFCNKQQCDASTDTCLGLMCQSGICLCALPAV